MKMKKVNYLRSSLMLIILLSIFGITSSCTKTPAPGTPGPNEVFIQGSAFSPSTITVSAGTTITWTNNDAVAHTVTSDTPGSFSSGSIGSGSTWSHLFNIAGAFPYHCSIHTSMTASVTVN
jgi:plastocyanin